MNGLDVAELKAAVTGARFLDLVAELGGKPRKAGTHWRCACFMHGGTGQNLVISPTSGLWHCMSTCGGGDAIAMAMRARSLDFREALAWLAQWAGFHVDAPPQRMSASARRRTEQSEVAAPAAPQAPSVDTRAFLAALSDRVAESSWSTPVARWLLEVRGIEPDAAHALGCRDWSTRRCEIAELFDATPTDVLEAVGFAREGRVHPAVLGCIRGEPEWAAVAVPIWRLGRPYPERWRFRLIEPRATRGGGTIKSFGPYATDLPVDLLGAGRPGRLEAHEVQIARMSEGVMGADLLMLVEGEPDWWSATEAVDGHALALGVCGSPTRWREAWPTLAQFTALGVRRVAVCVHHGARSKDGRGHGERFADVVAAACARAGVGFTRKLAAEGRDLNDIHRAGRLREWLADVLEVRNER